MNKHRPCDPPARKGIVLLATLACLTAISLLLAGMLQQSLRQRRQTKTHARLVQARHLADAAIDRALWKLSRDQDYSGETWGVGQRQGLADDLTIQISVNSNHGQNTISATVMTEKATNQLPLATRTLEQVTP